ncbi:cytochrome P450 [Clathrospora elynae]|uniref:Cytochrome P450 n=1 Tax=Clathrospora elynae TaxID=706981 RepID=A0A6A5SY20_9PLEO|nr:cytochrome P450 [Clathrospora elynae]
MALTLLDGYTHATTVRVLWSSILVGACFHVAIARASFEFEQYMIPFLSLASVVCIGEVLLVIILGDLPVGGVFLRSLTFWTGFSAGLFASLSVYRLVIHRCRRYPGPPIAKLTRFYAAYLNAKDGQFYQEMAKLHDQYGDYLRMGPREISILDPAAIPLIYGPESTCRKGTLYSINSLDSDKVSIIGIREPSKYRPRRRAWDRGLSIKAMRIYQPRVKSLTDVLVKQLRNRTGQPLDATTWTMLYGFDVMGDVSFGQSFANMATGQEHPAIHAMHKYLGVLGPIMAIPWFPLLISAIPGMDVGFTELFGICAKVLKDKQQIFDKEKQPTDIVAWFLKAIKERDDSASPTKESLDDDTRAVIIGGSDTISNTFANALFYLVKYPEVQRKLCGLLNEAIPEGYVSWNYTQVETVSYIDDIINETLRLKPPTIQGLPRETPAQGIRIGDKHIPGYVNVSVPVTLIQRDPRWWKQPNEFIPERWMERRGEMGTDDSPWFPFQMGMHACAGKNLAYLTLRIALSALVQNFDITFAPGETGEKFDGDYLSSFVMTLRPLQLVFIPRSRA